MENIIYILCLIVILKIILNVYYLVRVKRYYSLYNEYVKDPKWEFYQYKPSIIKLIKMAGVKDSFTPLVKPAGFGKLISANLSTFDNITLTDRGVPQAITGMFNEAIGVYKSRIIDAVNPLFWVELVIFLPKKIAKYLDVNPEKFLVKIFQILWWFINLLIVIIIAIYQNDINQYIKHIFR